MYTNETYININIYNICLKFSLLTRYIVIYCTFLANVKFRILLLWSITRECNIFTFFNVHWKNIEIDRMFRFELTILRLNKVALRIVFPRDVVMFNLEIFVFYKFDSIPRVFPTWHLMIKKRKFVVNFCSESFFIQNVTNVQ